VPWDGSSWGEPSLFLERTGDRTLVYPMFSPTGEWLAYTEGKGGHNDQEMLLFVTGADAPAPIELARANRVVNNVETDGKHQNAGPTWAPPGDLHWVAFNSMREYGVVSPAGTQQIWVAAVDVDRIAQGEDPSFPAFRLPSQGLDENNHRAFWALDVREESDGGPASDAGPAPFDAGPPPPSDAGTCAATGAACDPAGAGCCVPYDVCDTRDDGETYRCITLIGG
jgi:hypothetical protein